MPYGYIGKILHVDLTKGNLSDVEPPEIVLSEIPGGKRHGYGLHPARDACRGRPTWPG